MSTSLPDAECVSSQNSRGRNSVRSEAALGSRARPPAHRRELRGLKKCLLKNLEFPPTQEPVSSKPSRSNQFLQRGKTIFHRGFTRPTHSQGDDMDTHERIAIALEAITSPNSLLTTLHSFLEVPGSARRFPEIVKSTRGAADQTKPDVSGKQASITCRAIGSARGRHPQQSGKPGPHPQWVFLLPELDSGFPAPCG